MILALPQHTRKNWHVKVHIYLFWNKPAKLELKYSNDMTYDLEG